ncbi:predicted protein [Postia placenta Mad-698-R]|nr:predicted protein [Postia placenta Mad-698-R]
MRQRRSALSNADTTFSGQTGRNCSACHRPLEDMCAVNLIKAGGRRYTQVKHNRGLYARREPYHWAGLPRRRQQRPSQRITSQHRLSISVSWSLMRAQSAPRANEPAAKERERIHTLAQRAADTDPPSPTHADADIWYGQLRTSWLHSRRRAGDLGRTAGPVTAQRGSGRADWLRGMRLRPGACATEPRWRQLGLKWAAGEDAFTPVFQLNWDLIGKRQIDAHLGRTSTGRLAVLCERKCV